jgi:hypothetical protein
MLFSINMRPVGSKINKTGLTLFWGANSFCIAPQKKDLGYFSKDETPVFFCHRAGKQHPLHRGKIQYKSARHQADGKIQNRQMNKIDE